MNPANLPLPLERSPGLKSSPTTEGPAFSSTRSVVLLLTSTLFIGLALRSYRLWDRSLWFDEAFCWRVIDSPITEMLKQVGRDNHPPLYFLALKGWVYVFGQSVVALRTLSVLLGGLTILGMYLFATECFSPTPRGATDDVNALARGRGIGLVVAMLVALSVFQIRWSWEARMYSMGTALAALSSWALFRALRPGAGFWQWGLYGLLALLFAYTHYYSLFSLAAQGIFLAGFLLVRVQGNLKALFREDSFWYALLAATVVVMGSLPWLPIFFQQRAQVQANFWTQPVTRWSVPNVCWQLFIDPEHADCSHIEALVASIVCIIVLLSLLWKPRAGECYVFLAAAVPFGLSVLVSFLDTKVFHLRYFLFAHLFFLAALAVVVSRIPWKLERRPVCLILFVAFLWTYVVFWQKLEAVE